MTLLKKYHFLTIVITFLIALSGCASKPIITSDPLSLTHSRYAHAAVNDGKNIYVIGGTNKGPFLSSIEIINPVTKEITVLKNKIIPRRYFSAIWDGKHSIYIIGGVSLEHNKFKYEKRVEVFNTLTHEVSFVKSHPAPTRVNTAVLLNDEIIVLGGSYPRNGRLSSTAIVSVYSIKDNKWMKASADMPTAKTTRAVVYNEMIYVVGGYTGESSLSVFERFNPRKNEWTSLPDIPVKISAHSATVIGDKLYTFGDYKNLSLTYEYDFISKKWTEIDVNYKASRHNAVTTLGENTYVIGGIQGANGPFLNDIQIFKL